jgi:hypothetical protein
MSGPAPTDLFRAEKVNMDPIELVRHYGALVLKVEGFT